MMNILLSSNNSQMEDSIFARRHSFAPRNFLSMLSCSTTAAGDEQLTVKDTGGGRAEERGREQVARGHAEEDRDTMSTSAATATTMASCASSSSSCCPVLATTSAIPSGAIPDSILPQGVWSRSAGRKKSHPVWTFFQDLRDSNGIGGVSCMHCDWTGDDRSPNNLKTHLKRCHDTDGVFKQFTLNMALTPTQPYVKRKRPHHREQQQQQANERVEEPASLTASIAVNHQSAAAAAEQQNGTGPKPPPSPTMPGSCDGASSANAIPCSASSAFSKYSTAALLMDSCLGNGGCSVGTTSPSHGAEAPKQYSREASQPSQLQPQPLPAPRPKYGLEAITGLDTTSHLATDPEMLANLEVAVTMNRLVNEYHHQQQKNNLNAVQAQQVQNVHHQQQQQKTTQNGNGQHQQNILGQQLSGQQLNELLAIYAASVTASALQHQQQKGTDQQQLAAQQAAAAVSWLYNWEWMAAATAAAGTQQQQKPVNGLNMSGSPMSKKVGSGVQQQNVNGRSIAPVNGAVTNNCANSNNNNNGLNMLMNAGLPLLSALSLGGKMGGNVAKFAGGNNGAVNAEAVQPKSGLNNNNSLANGMETKQNQQQQNNNHHQLAQKRKSPAEERDCAASLLVLADTASTAAVEQQQRGSASPPKSRKMGELCKKQQQQQQDNPNDGCCSGADGAGEALAESLVLYGMHRIAMELQLSYSVHGNKAGRAEYAFYCTNTGTANANVQRMVTLTESADQVLHIREYANGTVVAEECWPKSAEPGTLLLSLRDKCQRRLCA